MIKCLIKSINEETDKNGIFRVKRIGLRWEKDSVGLAGNERKGNFVGNNTGLMKVRKKLQNNLEIKGI